MALNAKQLITEFLDFISPDGAIRELRVLLGDDRGTLAGPHNDAEIMAQHAAAAEKRYRPAGTYFTLNSVKPEAVAKLATGKINEVRRNPYSTVRDGQIEKRDLYLVDFDPKRPSGVSSTEDEKQAARDLMLRVLGYLTEAGWPAPIIIDSGNGFHLLYRGNDWYTSRHVWRWLLKALAEKFGTDRVGIDASVANASRISRLPYTWNRKGPDTPDRPHRIAKVLQFPIAWQILTFQQLDAYAHTLGYTSEYDVAKKRELAKAKGDAPTLVLDEEGVRQMMAEFPEILIPGNESTDGDITYFALNECPFVGREHRGQHVGRGKTTIILRPGESIGFSCFSDDCSEHKFTDLLKLLRAKTGRGPSIPIWTGTASEMAYAERQAEREESYEHKYHVHYISDPEFRWEADTQRVLKSETFGDEGEEYPTHPHAWGLFEMSDLAKEFFRVADPEFGDPAAYLREENFEYVGRTLGPSRLYWLHRMKCVPEYLTYADGSARQINPHCTGYLESRNERCIAYYDDAPSHELTFESHKGRRGQGRYLSDPVYRWQANTSETLATYSFEDLSTDPADWNLTLTDLHDVYVEMIEDRADSNPCIRLALEARRRMQAVIDAGDLGSIGETLGPKVLFLLHRRKCRPILDASGTNINPSHTKEMETMNVNLGFDDDPDYFKKLNARPRTQAEYVAGLSAEERDRLAAAANRGSAWMAWAMTAIRTGKLDCRKADPRDWGLTADDIAAAELTPGLLRSIGETAAAAALAAGQPMTLRGRGLHWVWAWKTRPMMRLIWEDVVRPRMDNTNLHHTDVHARSLDDHLKRPAEPHEDWVLDAEEVRVLMAA